MAVAFISFSDFAPGGSGFGDRLRDVRNVLPLYGAYHPMRVPQFGSVPPGAETAVLGAYTHIFPTGIGTGSYLADAATVFAGTKLALYDTNTDPWTDLSRAGGYAAAGEPGAWRFASFGNDVWAVNGLDAAQRRTNNAGAFADGIPTSTFKPIGRFIAPVREFMVHASLANAGRAADEFAWSDANDATWFDDRTGTRPQSLAGAKAIRSRPGQITGFVGGEFGKVYKRRSIHALQFTGGSDVFRLDEVSHGVGCALPGSLISGEDGDYFFSGRGFYVQRGLGAPEKISPPEIDQLFTDGVHFQPEGFYHGAVATMAEEENVMQGVEDWKSGVKIWYYRSGYAVSPVSTPLNAGVAYDPSSGLWSRLDGATLREGLNVYRAVPYPENATETTNDQAVRLVIFRDADGLPTRTTLSSGHEACFFKTQKQAISFPEMTETGLFRLRGVLPIFTTPQSSTWALADPQPSDATVEVTIRTSNDPHFTARTDADGGTVNPRSVVKIAADANEWGWRNETMEGRVWEIEVAIPEAAEWRNFLGVWIDGDPVK